MLLEKVIYLNRIKDEKLRLIFLEKILRRLHLISIVIIILVELAFLVAVVTCCITQSKSKIKINRFLFLILNLFYS
jgi:hypothetical protein